MDPKDYFDEGCFALIDAIFWISIVDYVDGLRFNRSHESRINELKEKKNYNYSQAVGFLNQTEKGRYILRILRNLTEEQLDKLLSPGGLSWSNTVSYYDTYRKRWNERED